MVILFVTGAVGREFDVQFSQTKDYRIGIYCLSAKHAALRSKSKDWLGIFVLL